MGLDISAHSKARYLRQLEEDEDVYERNLRSVRVNPHFIEHADSLKDNGVYQIDGEEHRFRAGSYGGYNQFRKKLCISALGVNDEEVFNNPEKFKGKPFFEMIFFSDCEGVIGPKTSAKLAKDFADHEAAIVGLWSQFTPDWREYYLGRYADWKRAFELAADDGFVDFH